MPTQPAQSAQPENPDDVRAAAPNLTLRPHHILCAIGYQGKGYSDAFTANMTAVVTGRLRAPGGGREKITITTLADSLCAPCPHKRGSGCDNDQQIKQLDLRHASRLKLRHGDQMSWTEAKSRVLKFVPVGSLSELCKGCQWLDHGLCNAALQDLHQKS